MRIFGPKRDELIGGWRKLHIEELHNLYSSPNTMIKSKIGRTCRTNLEKKNVLRILVGKPEGKKTTPGRPRRRWVDNIKMYLREIGCNVMDWIDLAQNRDQWRALVSTVMIMNLRVLKNAGKFLSSYVTGVFSRRAPLHEVSYNVRGLNWICLAQGSDK
jgi:hypothetical protein